LSGQTFFWANVLLAIFAQRNLQMSFWADVFLGKCPSRQMSSGQMSFWANGIPGKATVFWANVVWANVFLGKCLFWANVVWANVLLGKRCMGNYLY
jgi:hypothetical protein